MRKEVKLGMSIGGGLVLLLVVYLLVAPPSNGKKAVNLVDKSANTNVIDVTQPGDLQSGDTSGGIDNRTLANLKPDDIKNPDIKGGGDVKPTDSKPADTKPGDSKSSDSWKVLDTGKAPKPSQEKSASEKALARNSSDTGVSDKNSPEKNTAEKNTAEKNESDPANKTLADAGHHGEKASLYFNPNDAWGGGVSTDALGSASPAAAKTTLLSGQSTPNTTGTHIVKSGESFSSIAAAEYGSAALYPHILRANPKLNPTALQPGMVVTIPPLDSIKATPKETITGVASMAPETRIDPSHQYKVQSGDSLYKIAIKLYGKSSYVDKIYEKNKTTIGQDPKRLKLGMILELPEKTAAAPTAAATAEGDAQPK